MQNSTSERKPLLRISNLKQYFPLKTKGLFVKANDGITLDIYEGETLGLVGESGCGKSTFGRTLLQLYRQTDGRTMYYGRSLDDLAPKYVGETIRTLEKRRKQMKELEARRDAVQREYDAMQDGKEKYAKANDLEQAKKEANDAFLDMANLVGGFLTVDNLAPVTEAFMGTYRLSSKQHEAEERLETVALNLEEAKFSLEQAKKDTAKAGKVNSLTAKVEKLQAKADEINREIDSVKAELVEARKKIDEMRKPYADDPEFQRVEAFRDDGIDLDAWLALRLEQWYAQLLMTAPVEWLPVEDVAVG